MTQSCQSSTRGAPSCMGWLLRDDAMPWGGRCVWWALRARSHMGVLIWLAHFALFILFTTDNAPVA
jgi:hypothetical protein